MQIKLNISRSGPNFSQVAGQIVEVEDEEALRLIDRGYAEPVEPVEPVAAKATKAKTTAKKQTAK